ncbi:hypothetical protein [Pseudomonas sp. WS 5071]|uniref:hypothetical protein n=1 Tax=Pseudomonas sp. WS 5071 TaxID=2717479 RepID=UPI001473EC9D|nr:hypothetical protein [Pseudomonas sp. WS 5071]NMY73332.1 hypothetical protein [Pseudomonas sp. WS 5071]
MGDQGYVEHLYNLKFSAPKLSFEISKPEDPPRVRLTLDMIGGMIVTTQTLAGGIRYVSRISTILPVGGPQLWMDQLITKGEVGEAGEVVIDLQYADNFNANFVVGALAQREIGMMFKAYVGSLSTEQKRFPLGNLIGDFNGVLTPVSFEIKTRASVPDALKYSLEYGDGAVMLFITLKDGVNGTAYPSDSSIYLIPSGNKCVQYTATLLLSSKLFMQKLIKPELERAIGLGLVLAPDAIGSDVANTLKAEAGAGVANPVEAPFLFTGQDHQGNPALMAARIRLQGLEYSLAHDDLNRLRVSVDSKGTRLRVTWSTSGIHQYVIHHGNPDKGKAINFDYNYSVVLRSEIQLDELSGVVSFSRANVEESNVAVNFLSDGGDYWNYNGKEENKKIIIRVLKGLLDNVISGFKIPSIDTFFIRNLLFPGQNAMQVTQAFLPGDLVLFGDITPLKTTVAIAPLNTTIEAGSQLQFSVTPPLTNPVWTVRDVDGETGEIGEILEGLYHAPAHTQLKKDSLTVMVTVQGTLKGVPVINSTLVSVMHTSIQTDDIYFTCEPGNTKLIQGVTLRDEMLSFRVVTSSWGSTLEEVEGEINHRLYRAGTHIDPEVAYPVDIIELRDSVSAVYIYSILVKTGLASLPVVIDESSDPAQGCVTFLLLGNEGPVESVKWSLLAGVGDIDECTGVYTEPDTIPVGSLAVISGVFEIPGVITVYGIMAVPLPLSRYVEIIESVNRSIRLSRLD